MIKVFNSEFVVTQGFGLRPEYYGQFGLLGHEGLDGIPKNVNDKRFYSLPFKGKVIKDFDMASKGGAYGINCTVWYPEIKEAWQYCHASVNYVGIDQELPPTTYLGDFGATGNTQGAHLHINRFEVDDNGIRLNKNNGYLGGIDPLPFLQGMVQGMVTLPQKELDEIIKARDNHWNELQELKKTTVSKEKYDIDIASRDNQIKERDEEIERLRTDVIVLTNDLAIVRQQLENCENKPPISNTEPSVPTPNTNPEIPPLKPEFDLFTELWQTIKKFFGL